MNRPRELDMVVLRRHPDGTPAVWCDPDIADVVGALNAGGVPTVASCSGHGERPGNVALVDGRELIVAADWNEARKVEAAFEIVEGRCFRCGNPITGPVCETCEAPLLSRAEPEPPSVGNIIGYRGPPRDDSDEQPFAACPGPAPPQTAHNDAPHPNCPECGQEADSRSRAIEIAAAGIPNQYVDSDSLRRKIAEGCIDDAIDSGHLLTREHFDEIRQYERRAAERHARDAAEAKRERDEALARVSPAEIDQQRDQGWPDFHPEDYCHRCGAPNPSWSVDALRFNAAMGPSESHGWEGIVCIGCFVQLHEAATGLTCTWRLVPDTPFRPKDEQR